MASLMLLLTKVRMKWKQKKNSHKHTQKNWTYVNRVEGKKSNRLSRYTILIIHVEAFYALHKCYAI